MNGIPQWIVTIPTLCLFIYLFIYSFIHLSNLSFYLSIYLSIYIYIYIYMYIHRVPTNDPLESSELSWLWSWTADTAPSSPSPWRLRVLCRGWSWDSRGSSKIAKKRTFCKYWRYFMIITLFFRSLLSMLLIISSKMGLVCHHVSLVVIHLNRLFAAFPLSANQLLGIPHDYGSPHVSKLRSLRSQKSQPGGSRSRRSVGRCRLAWFWTFWTLPEMNRRIQQGGKPKYINHKNRITIIKFPRNPISE